MSDWGFGQAVSKLYTGTSASERNKNEMATIGLMENQYVKENAEKDAAQQKKQAYDKDVQDFANKLLGPDRDKINQRAKILQSKVRNQIKFYGGDMTRFFANGGGKVMDDYRSSVVNSQEATQYMENQKNAFQLTDAQMKGFGGRINPNDLQSLKDYNENGGGKITYSGLLNEIKMPDASKYDYGTEIPAEDIYALNKYAIDGDFISITGRPPADKIEALNFIKYNHGSKGSNTEYQKAIQANQLAWKKEANDKIKNDQDYQVAMAKIAASGGRKTKTVEGPNGSVEVYDDSEGGIVNPNSLNYKGQAGFNPSRSEETWDAVSSLGKEIPASDFFTGMQNNKEGLSKLEQVSKPADPSSISFYDQSLNEKRHIVDFYNYSKKDSITFDIGQALANNKQFSIMNARKLYENKEAVIAKKLLNITDDKQIDLSRNIVHDWQPSENDFRSNGSKFGDNEDPIKYDNYNGDWTIKGIYMGGVGKSKKNKESIIMNLMDGDKVAKNNGANYQEMYANATIKPVQIIVMTNDRGDVAYRALDNNKNTATDIKNALGDDDDTSAVSRAAYQQNNGFENDKKVKEAKQEELYKFWKEKTNDPYITRQIQSQLAILNPGGISVSRDALVKAFYGMTANKLGIQNTQGYASLVTETSDNFITAVRDYDSEKFPMSELLKSGSNNYEILQQLIDWSAKNGQDENIPMLHLWQDNLSVVNKYGAK